VKAPILESVFLNRSAMPETRDFRRVLILGGDKTGHEVAGRLADEGFEALVLDNGKAGDATAGKALAPDVVLEEVHGFVGAFEALLSGPEGPSTERIGFVVAAPPAANEPKFANYGLLPSESVISLSDLELLLDREGALPDREKGWFHVVFLCGLEGESDPALFARVFDAAEKLREKSQVQPYVFTRHVKVAAPGLERRYRQIREEGTLFFKFDGAGPVFEHGPDGLTMLFADPVLGVELELVPDLIVVDEEQRPPSNLKPLLAAIPSSAVTAPYLQPESTRFSGVRTAKAGMFALGASGGRFSADAAAADTESLVVALKTAALEETAADLPGPPIVDPAKCTICLTCVRLCPHGAMSFQKRAEADPASCVRCGICSVECPMEAIKLEPPSGKADVAGQIATSLAGTNSDRRIVAFLCSRSAARAMESAGTRIGHNLVPIVVPCAGTVDPTHILSAFREGADGVLVAGCHTGNCASIYGTVLAQGRTSRAGLILEESGIDAGRLIYRTFASNTPGDFVRAVAELESNIADA
jgi:quinone-modifying oxidoreductase, subunit QmoB